MARIGPVTPEERQGVIQYSPYWNKYEQGIDRESAYELLNKRSAVGDSGGGLFGNIFGSLSGGSGGRMGMGEAFTKSLVRSAASSVGRIIVNSITGKR